jgi:hypothetical protein
MRNALADAAEGAQAAESPTADDDDVGILSCFQKRRDRLGVGEDDLEPAVAEPILVEFGPATGGTKKYDGDADPLAEGCGHRGRAQRLR